MLTSPFSPLPAPPSELGESPFWHPGERALYWLDIPARRLNRLELETRRHHVWPLQSEPGSCAPLLGGGLLIAMRDGLWRFDLATGNRHRVAAPPYDPGLQRFNDGKADPQGRFWVGTIDDRRAPEASLYRFAGGRFERLADGITNSNGLAFAPDGRTLYWADTRSHVVHAFDVDALDGRLSRRRVFAQFTPRAEGMPLERYGGRPDGAAVDSEGAYWCAMFEGQRLLRLSPEGELLADIPLPVRCPTMPCFGGDDLRTLFLTTAREKRPADELERQPWAGRVLCCQVAVPGLPVHFARL